MTSPSCHQLLLNWRILAIKQVFVSSYKVNEMQPKIYRNKFNCLGQAIAIIHLYRAEVASEIWHFQHHRVELGTTVTTKQMAISTDKPGLWIFPGLLPALTGQVPSTLQQGTQGPISLRQTGKYIFFNYYLFCRSLVYEKQLSCHPLQPWSKPLILPLIMHQQVCSFNNLSDPVAFCIEVLSIQRRKWFKLWQQPWTKPAFHSLHLALKLHFPPISLQQVNITTFLPPTFAHSPPLFTGARNNEETFGY